LINYFTVAISYDYFSDIVHYRPMAIRSYYVRQAIVNYPKTVTVK